MALVQSPPVQRHTRCPLGMGSAAMPTPHPQEDGPEPPTGSPLDRGPAPPAVGAAPWGVCTHTQLPSRPGALSPCLGVTDWRCSPFRLVRPPSAHGLLLTERPAPPGGGGTAVTCEALGPRTGQLSSEGPRASSETCLGPAPSLPCLFIYLFTFEAKCWHTLRSTAGPACQANFHSFPFTTVFSSCKLPSLPAQFRAQHNSRGPHALH